jgi:hypothetical protein
MSAMPVPMATSDPAIVSAYEDLRQVARGDDKQGRSAGYALLLRSGMAAWMMACAALTGSSPPPSPCATADGQFIPAAFQIEIVVLLANMALSVHASQGETTC